MKLLQPLRVLLTLGLLVSTVGIAQGTKGTLFDSLSKDKLVRSKVFENGDYCHVREYLGEEHTGLRISYFIAERVVSEKDVRSLIVKLAKDYSGKRESPLISSAIQKFKGSNSKPIEHWQIDIPNADYAEFFVSVDWVGESVAIQIKYYK